MKTGDVKWIGVFLAVSAVFIVPESRTVVMGITKAHPYAMGFVKFAVLSTMGELLAIRMAGGEWRKPPAVVHRFVIWGLIGIIVTLMFEVFGAGVRSAAAKGLLWSAEGRFAPLSAAFLISLVMNFAFAPVFMIGHRLTDTYLDLRYGEGRRKVTTKDVLAGVDWPGLMGFVVFKTIPFFWLPAHSITFLLPGEYRILMAAYLSIALGIILSFAKGRRPKI